MRGPTMRGFFQYYKDLFNVDLSPAYDDYMKNGNYAKDIVAHPEKIIRLICFHNKIDISTLTGKSKKREIVFIRYFVANLFHGIYTLKNIGLLLGGRDHSTVKNLIKKYNWEYRANKVYRMHCDQLEHLIKYDYDRAKNSLEKSRQS